MKKFLVIFLWILLILTTGSRSSAMLSSALFGDAELIRVAYSPTGTIEWATDLGNVTTLATYSNQIVGGGGDAITVGNILGATGFSDINVAYFAVHNDAATMAGRVAWATFAHGLTTPPVSNPKWFQNFGTAAGSSSLTYSFNNFNVQGAAPSPTSIRLRRDISLAWTDWTLPMPANSAGSPIHRTIRVVNRISPPWIRVGR